MLYTIFFGSFHLRKQGIFEAVSLISLPFIYPLCIYSTLYSTICQAKNRSLTWTRYVRERFLIYFPAITFSQKPWKRTAAWARVAVPEGVRVVSLVPLTRPTARAQLMDS